MDYCCNDHHPQSLLLVDGNSYFSFLTYIFMMSILLYIVYLTVSKVPVTIATVDSTHVCMCRDTKTENGPQGN